MKNEKTKIWGVVSFVTSLISIPLIIMPYFGIVFSIFAIVTAGIQFKKGWTGLSVAGLSIGILGTCINVVMLLLLAFVLAFGL